jgi:hypothetical protein
LEVSEYSVGGDYGASLKYFDGCRDDDRDSSSAVIGLGGDHCSGRKQRLPGSCICDFPVRFLKKYDFARIQPSADALAFLDVLKRVSIQ